MFIVTARNQHMLPPRMTADAGDTRRMSFSVAEYSCLLGFWVTSIRADLKGTISAGSADGQSYVPGFEEAII